jgi:MoxR-like ATPase
MATQNPIETEGTYPLPEAQVDRFMMKVLVGYPKEEEEFVDGVGKSVVRVDCVVQELDVVSKEIECSKIWREW